MPKESKLLEKAHFKVFPYLWVERPTIKITYTVLFILCKDTFSNCSKSIKLSSK